MTTGKLKDLLNFIDANKRFNTLLNVEIPSCECGKPARRMVLEYRFKDNFILDHREFFVCNRCYNFKSSFNNKK